ncbi:MAG: RluA family pseudouridine synthase [Bacteroidaceae bacterium]|nr:RluA family pseudouridine synthase [Bacteroidaceae bacterium]
MGEVALPERFNNPFSYVPHPLCVRAAEEVRRVVVRNYAWSCEVAAGKMFGVLVVRDACERIGFLAAFSGLLGGCNEHDYFVPAVFDFLASDGYFKCEEREISYINSEILRIKGSEEYLSALSAHERVVSERDEALAAEREAMRAGKAAREERRVAGNLSPEEEAQLLNESRFAKAEYKRNVKRWDERVALFKAAVAVYDEKIAAMRAERKRRSAALQQWLFDNFVFLDSEGERRSLSQIFADTAQGVPPAGAGECAAPKLLQYAFLNGLSPLAMAEFWLGESRVGEVRRDGCFYGSCISKCKPILSFMLGKMDVEPSSQESASLGAENIKILYEDDSLMVVNKPSGMLSVPGRVGGTSVEEYLQCNYNYLDCFIHVAHRLDMATSGLLLVAKSLDVFSALQREFAARRVKKRYTALLDGVIAANEGEISLPLSADYDNRPRQKVDFSKRGKEAVTRYETIEVVEYEGRVCTRVAFYPLTGRTHQLRVHAAYVAGLNTPIVGDELYGSPDKRLMLHADRVEFTHPVTGEVVAIECPAEF